MGEELEGIEVERVESGIAASQSQAYARVLLDDPNWMQQLGTNELAAACAELRAIVEREQAAVDLKKGRFETARRMLCERFAAQGTKSIKVETSAGVVNAYRSEVYAPRIVSDRRGEVIAWCKEHAPDLVAEDVNDQGLKSRMKRLRDDGDGLDASDLVDRGALVVFEGSEVRFRKA